MEILQKVRKLVPFVRDESNVKFGGTCTLYPENDSYVKTHRWQNGWREEGNLILDCNSNLIGKVYEMDSNGRGESWETVRSYPDGVPAYFLEYSVKFDTEEEEWASLYRIEKPLPVLELLEELATE